MPRTKAQRQARRAKTGRDIMKGLKAADKFLKRTKAISKTAEALTPYAGKYMPVALAGTQIAKAAGYGYNPRSKIMKGIKAGQKLRRQIQAAKAMSGNGSRRRSARRAPPGMKF